ncbi:hypothetical protein PHYSODRAFT_303318 [Phytophthora sojae]|uniref:Uncharacterized protein n=1 Tax=Phytophthora sojae (strain P6497) TaxID=1094619 RepID=G4ZRV4_PHYSP|nr:hypothetical protein PHYSODRAFT_303318 [Phytophthora sojae]EGZ13991.1 hypothetical protein PHYSODRAFT_303318 [Phytophthora sojae]|eukprot:XP_009531420.1 hypothetical protein PHYSODRAFT_303318 [Phytophthora sojae]
MDSGVASHHIRTENDSRQLGLTGPSTVIAVDRLNYTLRTGATVNAMVLNALELMDRHNEVTVAFQGFVVHDVPDIKARTNPKAGLTNDVDLTFSDSDDEGKTESAPAEQAYIELVRLDNRSLRKRATITDPRHQDLQLLDDVDVPGREPLRCPQARASVVGNRAVCAQCYRAPILHRKDRGPSFSAVTSVARPRFWRPRAVSHAFPPILSRTRATIGRGRGGHDQLWQVERTPARYATE